MLKQETGPLTLFSFENLLAHGSIRHFVSTRAGGFSPPPYESLNLGLHVSDSPENVRKNRERLASTLGFPLNNLMTAKQVHGSNIQIVTPDMRGSGASDYENAIDATDALITNASNVCLTIFVADCVPLLFYDSIKNVVAAAHAGWRGTVELIGQKTVQMMNENFGCRPKDILVGIGPSIGPCCYQVGTEVISQMETNFGDLDGLVDQQTSDGKGHLNLWEANRRQFLDAGIPAENIETAKICTCCNADTFFSERHHKGTGRFGAGIMLLNEQCAECTAINCTWCSK